ncbi:MAG: PAS domain S-box protein [Bacteroidota bacterium]|nr:PAS domain S-box protein [Bacteroidota bacterium]
MGKKAALTSSEYSIELKNGKEIQPENIKIFHDLFDCNPSAIALSQQDMSITMVNKAFCKMFDCTWEDVLGNSWAQHLPPEDLECIKRYNRQRIANPDNAPSEYEFKIYNKDNKIRHILMSVSVAPDINKVITSFKDITQRKHAEEALIESEIKFRNLFENSPLGKTMTMLDGYEHGNKSFCTMIGYAQEELKLKKWMDIIPSEDIQKNANIIQSLQKGEIPIANWEKRYIHKNGAIIWANVTSYLQRDNEGRALYFISTIDDITERKFAEKALREIQEQYRLLFNSSMDAIILATPDGLLLSANPAACKIFGYTEQEMLSLTRDDIADIADPTLRTSIEEYSQSGNFRGELTMVRKDGSKFPAEVSISLFLDKEKRERACLIIRDITERKKTENALKESNRKINSIVNNLKGVVYQCSNDQEWTMYYISDGITELTGYSPEDITHNLKISYKSIIEPADQPVIWKEIQDALAHKKTFTTEYRIRTASGEHKWVWERGRGIFDNDKLIALEGYISDITERKLAEEALRQNEARLEHAQSLAHMGNWELDPVTGNDFWSKELFNLLGFDPAKGKPEFNEFLQILHPEYRAQIAETLNRVLKTGITEKEVYRTLPIHGTEKYFETNLHALKNAQGEIIRLAGTVMDITEQKLTEEALLKSRKEFQSYFDSASIGLSVTTADKIWVEVNKKLCQMLGYTREELTGHSWVDCSHPDDYEENNKHFLEVLEGKKDFYELDKRLIRKDGSIVYATLSTVCIRNDDGTVNHFLSSYLDITERKNSEKQIRTLSKAIEQSPTSIIITDADGKIEFVNAQFVSFMQYSLNDVKGRKPRIFNPGHSSPEAYGKMWETLNAKKIWRGEYLNRKKDETFFWENVIISPLFEGNGSIRNYILITEDVTEKKKIMDDLIIAKEKAEESDRLKTAFLHNISHEIRTPLNAIVGFSTLLNGSVLLPEKLKNFTGIIVQSSDQLLSIISDIISTATIEAGQTKIYEQEVNLNKVLKFTYGQFSARAEKQNISLNYHLSMPDSEANLLTDGTKITEILTNLVGNALKFTKEGSVDFGYKIIETGHIRSFQFYVRDTGIGIPAEMHEEIFKRFRQVEITSARQFGGSGLGLSISKAYVELLGGKIWLTSEPGQGSTFYFTIPYKKTIENSLIAELPENRQKYEGNKAKTILIAEDEDSNFMLLDVILAEANFKILRATNGLEAVEMCKSNPQIDLVLIDIKMPEMDGYQATKQIKKIRPDLPLIAQSAFSTVADKNKVLACGCSDFIIKPLDRKLLLLKINKLLK